MSSRPPSRYAPMRFLFLGAMLLGFGVADVVFYLWVSHRAISFWAALVGACVGSFSIGIWYSQRW